MEQHWSKEQLRLFCVVLSHPGHSTNPRLAQLVIIPKFQFLSGPLTWSWTPLSVWVPSYSDESGNLIKIHLITHSSHAQMSSPSSNHAEEQPHLPAYSSLVLLLKFLHEGTKMPWSGGI